MRVTNVSPAWTAGARGRLAARGAGIARHCAAKRREAVHGVDGAQARAGCFGTSAAKPVASSMPVAAK